MFDHIIRYLKTGSLATKKIAKYFANPGVQQFLCDI